MISLSTFNLRVNPFKDITPYINSESLIWAEMNEVKTKIENAYSDCLINGTKNLVLNWGPYGGGKTFSSYYFIKNKSSIEDLTQIYIRCPKDGSRSTKEFFKSIIDFITFEKIHIHINNLLTLHGEEALMSLLTPFASIEYAKAICLIGSRSSETKSLMNRFLYIGLTKTEMKNLGLAKDIQTDNDAIKFLSGIFMSFIGNDTVHNGSVVLWIDEMEDLIYYTSKHYKAFSQVLRDLFDNVSNRFLVFLNFTLSEGEESTVELILGAALWSRITRKIRYKQFNLDNALNYSLQLMNSAKIESQLNIPFDQQKILKILNVIPTNSLTPREINKSFNSLLSFLIERQIERIDDAVLNEWISSLNVDN